MIQIAMGEIENSVAQEPTPRVFFPNLDGLRFLAFLAVFLTHATPASFGALCNTNGVSRVIHHVLFEHAHLGVSFFFVLSGFLITYLLLAELQIRKTLDVKSFYIRRLLRIWPLYYCVLIFGLWAYPLAKHHLGLDVSSNLNPAYYIVFLSNFDLIRRGFHSGPMYLNVTWSIAIEEQFYVVWPLIFAFVDSRRHRLIFPAVIGISALFRYFHPGNDLVLGFHSMSAISDMAIGGLAAHEAIHNPRLVSFIRDLPRWSILGVYSVLLIWLALDYRDTAGPLSASLNRILLGGMFAFVILEQNYAVASPFKMSNFGKMSEWGRYTYGLYLLHAIVLLVIGIVLRYCPISETRWAYMLGFPATALALSITISSLSYRYFEKPFLELKKHFSHLR